MAQATTFAFGDTTGTNGPIQVNGYGNTVANPSSPIAVAALDSSGNLNIPGVVNQNQGTGTALVGLNGAKQIISLADWRLAGGTATILTGATATNTFFVSSTSGSTYFIASATPTTGLQTVASKVKTIVMPSTYVGGNANFTYNIVASATGGGSLTLASTNINCKVFQNNATTLGLGPLLSTNGAGQTGTAVAWVTTTNGVASGPVTTYSFACVPSAAGTSAYTMQPGSEIVVEVDVQCTNVSGTTNLEIGQEFIS